MHKTNAHICRHHAILQRLRMHTLQIWLFIQIFTWVTSREYMRKLQAQTHIIKKVQLILNVHKEIEKEKIQYAYLGQIRISQTWCMELTKRHIIAAHLSTHYPSCFIQHAMFPRSARRPFTYTNLILWTLFNRVLPDTYIHVHNYIEHSLTYPTAYLDIPYAPFQCNRLQDIRIPMYGINVN